MPPKYEIGEVGKLLGKILLEDVTENYPKLSTVIIHGISDVPS
jgi:hypothetical protein